ncbi:MAG: transposase [Bacteroidia bacterium]
MAEKFNGKYRIPSARAPWWDYGWNAAYFVTICVIDHRCHFADVVPITDPPVETRLIASLPTEPTDPTQFRVQLSEPGEIAARHWQEIPERFPYARLGEWVVMPNHIHGIVIIDHPDDPPGRDAINRVSTDHTTVRDPGGITGHHNPMLYDNLSRVMRWYKGRCTFEIRKTTPDFNWQERFYDHIIRDQASYDRVEFYIRQNPQRWGDDRYHPNNPDHDDA